MSETANHAGQPTSGSAEIDDQTRRDFLIWSTAAVGAVLAMVVGVVLLVSRWHGVRSLLGLGLSLLVVTRFVVPAILAGRPPGLVALVGALAVMLVTLYLTHGVGEQTTAAVVGTAVALGVTIVLGLWFIDRASAPSSPSSL